MPGSRAPCSNCRGATTDPELASTYDGSPRSRRTPRGRDHPQRRAHRLELGRCARAVRDRARRDDREALRGRSRRDARPRRLLVRCRHLAEPPLRRRRAQPAYEVDGRRVRWTTSANGYRLPTEAEWEYACRAGTAGPTYGPLEEIAWTVFDDVIAPQPVATKRANEFGLHDTLGNVWEWCWDYADPARYGDYRSMRGGGWADPSWSARASVRRGSAPDARIEDVGFRVARGAVGDGRGAQGWSPSADRERADIRGPLPVGWTPLRELLED
ncbi:formylglycine-generating enzyme family protein [Schumannella luteola]